jgi:hypothetical protein
MLRRLTILMAIPVAGAAQTQYYNLDAGRPNRIEDATPTERYGLEIQLAPVRVERLIGGSMRVRTEPKLSFGLLRSTELEVRAPFLSVIQPGAKNNHGFASVGIGGLHAFNRETRWVPAVAIGGEALLPIGSLAAPRTSYAFKLLATKTSTLGRVHLNAGLGTYSVKPPTPICAIRSDVPGAECSGPFIPDIPCQVAGDQPGTARTTACGVTSTQLMTSHQTRTYGSRWMAGAGIDRAFALQSLVITADVFFERFNGLASKADATAELGVRRQWTPQIMLDVGVARRFSGVRPGSSVTAGITYSLAVRPPANRFGR